MGRRLLAAGWRTLLAFLLLGLVLEALHGFKIGWYLDLANETRRLLFRLAHAHGALLSVLAILYALGLGVFPEIAPGRARAVSRLLVASIVLLPGGFFLGGLVIHQGDPGLGIVLAPIGALTLIVAVALSPPRRGRSPGDG